MPTLELAAHELAWWESGRGPEVVAVHDTAQEARVWEPLAEQLGGRARLVAYDRRGWGASTAPAGATATSLHEQADDLVAVVERLCAEPPVLCGAGLGAVACLDVLVRRPSLCAGTVLVEPPLLAFSRSATEQVSADHALVDETTRSQGPAAAVERFLAGHAPAIAPTAGRLAPPLREVARRNALQVFAELAAVPGWPLPLGELGDAERPSTIVLGDGAGFELREAAQGLAARLAQSQLRTLATDGLPHWDAADELARLVAELLDDVLREPSASP